MKVYEPYLLDMKTLYDGDVIRHFLLTLEKELTVEEFIACMAEENPEKHQSFVINFIEIATADNRTVIFCYPGFKPLLSMKIEHVELYEGPNSKDYDIKITRKED